MKNILFFTYLTFSSLNERNKNCRLYNTHTIHQKYKFHSIIYKQNQKDHLYSVSKTLLFSFCIFFSFNTNNLVLRYNFHANFQIFIITYKLINSFKTVNSLHCKYSKERIDTVHYKKW